jgi:hypothetical protein
MQRSLTLALIQFALAVTVMGCSSPPPPATPMTFENFNVQANHEKQISLEGYLRLPVTTLVSDTMLVELYEKVEGKGKFVPVSLYIGSGANQVEKPPKDYSDKDLKVHANDGTLLGLQDKVRVSGKLIYSPSSAILFKPVQIEKI